MDEENFPNIFDESKGYYQPPRQKKLERSNSDIIVSGLCAGIAGYLKTEPAYVRLLALLSLLFGLWGPAAYIIASYLIPASQSDVDLSDEESKQQRKVNFRTVVSGVMLLSGFYFGFVRFGFFSSERIFILPNEFMFPFIAIVIGVYYLVIKETDFQENENTVNSFYRSRKDRRFLGVCGGFAQYIDVESTTVRILFVVLSLLTLGLFALIYFLFALLSKMEKPDVETQQ